MNAFSTFRMAAFGCLLPFFFFQPVDSLVATMPLEANCNLFIPNAFSPNDDGTNDVFRPETPCAVLEYEFAVYSRWGDQVFYTRSIDEGWDGEVKGQPAKSDVYVYVLRLTYGSGEVTQTELKTGDVALLR